MAINILLLCHTVPRGHDILIFLLGRAVSGFHDDRKSWNCKQREYSSYVMLNSQYHCWKHIAVCISGNIAIFWQVIVKQELKQNIAVHYSNISACVVNMTALTIISRSTAAQCLEQQSLISPAACRPFKCNKNCVQLLTNTNRKRHQSVCTQHNTVSSQRIPPLVLLHSLYKHKTIWMKISAKIYKKIRWAKK